MHTVKDFGIVYTYIYIKSCYDTPTLKDGGSGKIKNAYKINEDWGFYKFYPQPRVHN